MVTPVARSAGLDLIIGAIAAIAVPPQIAVPDAMSNENLLPTRKIRPINKPKKKARLTNKAKIGKKTFVNSKTSTAFIDNPIKIIPIWSNRVAKIRV